MNIIDALLNEGSATPGYDIPKVFKVQFHDIKEPWYVEIPANPDKKFDDKKYQKWASNRAAAAYMKSKGEDVDGVSLARFTRSHVPRVTDASMEKSDWSEVSRFVKVGHKPSAYDWINEAANPDAKVLKRVQGGLKELQKELKSGNYKAAAGHAFTVAELLNYQVRNAKKKPVKRDPQIEGFVKKAIARAKAMGYSDGDDVIENLNDAGGVEEISDAIFTIAQEIGDRKGWGDEGVGELHTEILHDIDSKLLKAVQEI